MSQDFPPTLFPNLKTKRLNLRQTTIKDVEAIFAIFSDPQVTRFHNLDTFTQMNEAVKVIEQRSKGFEGRRGIRWGIACQSDNHLIGSSGFTWNQKATAAEVGYELASQFWRQGIMREALCAILQYGFDRKLEFIIAEVMLDNAVSKRLLAKLGFESQGVFEKHGFWQGKYHDLERFILTKSNFIAM